MRALVVCCVLGAAQVAHAGPRVALPADDDGDAIQMPADDAHVDEVVAPAPHRAWYQRGTWYARAGVLYVVSNAKSSEMVLSGVAGPASLAVSDGPIAGSRAEMGDVATGAVIVGFAMPAWGGELGVETVLAPPLTFQLRGGGTVADQSLAPTVLGQVPTGIPALGPELGTTKALPPVITAVYRARRGKAVRPYVGVGASYLHTYDSQVTNPVLDEIAPPRLSIDDAVSAVGQLGLDVHLGGRFWATADVKAMSGFSTTARVENILLKTPAFPLYESVYVGNATVDVVVRPVIVMIGAGASF
jgi:outer membrane protein W